MPASKRPAKHTATTKKAAAPVVPSTVRVKSSGGVKHVVTADGPVTLDDRPVEVSLKVADDLVARGKAVKL